MCGDVVCCCSGRGEDVVDAHTTEFLIFCGRVSGVGDCVSLSVCFVVCFVEGIYDVLKISFPCCFAFVLGKLGDGVGEVEEGSGWVVV